MTTKRIGFISCNDWVPWGGSEELWSQTAEVLAQRGLTVGVNVVEWSSTPKHIGKLIEAGCTVSFRENSFDREVGSIQQRIRKKIKLLIPARFVPPPSYFKWLDRFKPDLVVISQGGPIDGFPWKQECYKRGIPYVAIIHCVNPFEFLYEGHVDPVCQGYDHALINYFVSEGNIPEAEKVLAHPIKHTKIVRNPFKVPYTIQVPYPQPDPEFRLAIVAAMNTYHKGQDLIFEVLKMEKWKQRPLKVSLYGSGAQEGFLKRLKQLWQLDNVEFKGFQNTIPQIWETHHGLLMGSRMEGLPLALVEAMLCQRIAIVPDIAGHAEVIRDNENGFLAQAPVLFCLDEAMERAWQRRQDWQTMGEMAGKDIRAIIPPNPLEIFADELIHLLEQS
jgi:glycosyltransferase involved in cell wall biosynthesis